MHLKFCLKVLFGFLLWLNVIQKIQADTHWGAETNGLKAGLDILVTTNGSRHGLDLVRCQARLMFQTNAATIYSDGVNTNAFVFAKNVRYNGVILTNKEPFEYSYTNFLVFAGIGLLNPLEKNMRLELKDENGKDVARTERGEHSRRTFLDNPFFVSSRWGLWSWNAGEARLFAQSFQLGDYFKITQPGKYHLQMQIRIFPHFLHGVFDKPLFLPAVDVEIDMNK